MSDRLTELVANCNCLAIIGTEKNAGKTIVLNHLLETERRPGQKITSIGYDGEDIDQVTGTDKPVIYVGRGTLVATANDLIRQCDFTRELIRFTKLYTPLGEVVILRALSDGYAQIAGPSTTGQMTLLTRMLQEEKADRIIIDGAAARKSTAAVTTADSCILATGASYSPDLEKIVEHTTHIAGLLTLPAAKDILDTIKLAYQKAEEPVPENIGANRTVDCMLVDANKDIIITGNSLDDSMAELIALHSQKPLSVYFTVAITARLVQILLDRSRELRELKLIAADGTRFLLNAAQLSELKRRGTILQVIKPVTLRAVTVNPWLPEGFCLDSKALCARLKTVLSVEVFDIIADKVTSKVL